VKLTNDIVEYINYTEFDWHIGYKSIAAKRDRGVSVSVKTDGQIAEFWLRKINGEIVFWEIPTGKAGFAFWNVTKKCELIGRKYPDNHDANNIGQSAKNF
jgi:hypothetical protein